MIKSMTGFGSGEKSFSDYTFHIDAKSVNNRFLEVIVHLPRQLISMEDMIKKYVQSRINRGRIDIFLNFEESPDKKNTLKVDNELALVYYNSLLQLANNCKIPADIRITDIVSFPGVVSLEKEVDDLELFNQPVKDAMTEAIDSLINMRTQEGYELACDLEKRLDNISKIIEEISKHTHLVVKDYQEKLKLRIEELLEGVPIDESRLANEIAFFADKADISEELTRLSSHQNQFILNLKSEEPVGRKFEFILQEMNREINTIGSKANDLFLSQMVIEVKSELEKIREQIQNIE